MNKGTASILSVVSLSVLAAVSCGQEPTSDVGATEGALTTVTISGTVSTSAGPLAGVPVNLTNGATASALTDASGKYSFSVATAKTYTVTPALANCTFTPTSLTFTSVGLNHTSANFTGAGSGCTSGGSTGGGGSGGGTGAAGSSGLGTVFTTHKQYAQSSGPGNLTTTYAAFAQLSLPAGSYAVTARAFVIDADTGTRGSVFCTIEGGNLASTDLAPDLGTNLTTSDAVQLSAAGVLHFNCESNAGRFGPNGNVWLLTADMTAVQAQNVVFQ
jgi:hypothetical protein